MGQKGHQGGLSEAHPVQLCAQLPRTLQCEDSSYSHVQRRRQAHRSTMTCQSLTATKRS